jgi:hypothetical protein
MRPDRAVAGQDGLVTASDEAEHPRPTLATIRELYAHAFACAHPDCVEWLYQQESGSATPVLNSRVAHIHARRPNGPRWLPGMSPEDNRSAANLLLLCIPHSYEIDEDEERFPAAVLQQWRVAQRDEFAARRQAWTISDNQAREVAHESFSSPAIAAPILTAVVRAAERLVLRAASTRSGPAASAADWRLTWDQTRASFFAWDEEGNRVFAEPSRLDTERHQAAVVGTLNAACAQLEPLSEDVLADVAAAQHQGMPMHAVTINDLAFRSCGGRLQGPFAMSRMAQVNENLHRTGLTGRWTIPRAGASESVAAVHSTFPYRAARPLAGST